MAKRDVDLVIRARDEARKVLKGITEALDAMNTAQQDGTKTSGGFAGALTEVTSALKRLDKAVDGASAASKIASEMETAKRATDRARQSLAETEVEMEDVSKATERAAAVTGRFSDKLVVATKRLEAKREALAKANAEQTKLGTAVRKNAADVDRLAKAEAGLTAQIAAQAAKTQKANAALEQAQAVLAATTGGTKKAEAAVASATKARDREAARLAKSTDSLQKNTAALAAARAAQARLTAEKAAAAAKVAQLEQGVARAAKVQGVFRDRTRDTSKEAKRLAGEAERVKAVFDRKTESYTRAEAELQQVSAAAAEATAKLAGLRDVTRDTAGSTIYRQRDAVEAAAASYQNIRQEIEAVKASLVQIGPPTRQQAQTMQLLDAAASQARKEFLLQRDTLESLETAYREGDKTAEGFIATQERMQRTISETEKRLARLRAEAAKQARTIMTPVATGGGATGGRTRRPVAAPVVAPAELSAVDRMRAAINALYGDSRKAMSLTQRWRGEVLSLVAAYGGLFGVAMLLQQVIEATQQIEAATARLNVALEGTGQSAEQELDFLRRTADRLGLSIGGLAQEYSKFAIATKGTNLEGQRTRDIFIAVAEAARVNRNSQAEVQGVFTALTQIVSKGAVQMEELRQQLGDRLPGALQIMADGLGVSTAELIKMMEQGQVTSDALVPFAEELRKRFGSGLPEALQSTSAELGRLQNAAFQALLAFGEAGFLEAFNDLVRSTTELLKSAEFTSTLQRLSALFALLADAVRLVVENFEVFGAFLGLLIGIKAIPFIIGIAGALKTAAVGAAAFGAAMVGVPAAVRGAGSAAAGAAVGFRGLAVAVRALLSATGVGLAISLVGGVLGYWLTAATDATEAMEAHRIVVDAVKNAYEATGGAVDDWASKIEGVTKAQASTALRQATAQLDAVRKSATSALIPASGTEESRRRIAELIDLFRQGGLSADAYKRAIQDLADSDDTLTTDTVAALQDAADTTKDAEKAVDELRAVMVLLDEDASEAAKSAALVILGLKDSAAEAGAAIENELAAKTARFAEAMSGLKELIPQVAQELDYLAKSEAIEKLLLGAIQASTSWGQVLEAIRLAGQAQLNLDNETVNGAVSNSLVDRIIGVESGGNPNAKNPNSSATGLGQFISSTWLRMFKQYFPDRAAGMSDAMILALREDAQMSREMVQLYLRENAQQLQRAGIAITDANLYLAHFLGPGGARALIGSAPGTVANNVLGADQVSANASILDGKTREEVIAWAQRKVGVSESELAVQERLVEIDRERAEEGAKAAEEAANFHTQTQRDLEDAALELSLAKATNVERETAVALREAERKAAEAGTRLTDQERAKIAENVRLRYAEVDAEEAKEKVLERTTKAEEQVNLLLEQRAALEDQLESAVARNDQDAASGLRTQIDEINTKLVTAITNAQEMWRAVGGQAAETAIARLEAAKVKAQEFGDKGKQAFIDWKRVGDMFVSGLTNAFDVFSQKVVETGDVFGAARDAFLQFASDFLREIAQMIIRQAILNALQGTKLGGLLQIPVGVAHTGRTVGNGGMQRRVSASTFAGASRFHSGGLPGLSPNEVPIIAERGEEVLAKDDPRNILNGGAAGGAGGPPNVKIVNAIDAASFLAAALASAAGEEVLVNFMRANADTIQASRG